MSKDLQFIFKRPCLEVHGEVGSLAELIGYMQEESATLTAAFGDDMELVVQRISGGAAIPAAAEGEAGTVEPKTRKPRSPKVEAVAPAPLPVPAAAPEGADPLAIPEALRRAPTPPPAPVATVAAPPLAPLPPLPAAAPPVGVFGPKVVEAFGAMREGKEDGGQALADWLASAGLVQAGADYDAAMRVVLMTSDEKLKQIAEHLKVS